MRRAADYLASLRDGRAVFLDGRRVDDVTRHPAFAESARRIAERYEAATDSPDVTTCVDPASGKRIGAMWRSRARGRSRAAAGVHRFWAEGSYGLMGRTPDHVASQGGEWSVDEFEAATTTTLWRACRRARCLLRMKASSLVSRSVLTGRRALSA
jgi:hypothetical protein